MTVKTKARTKPERMDDATAAIAEAEALVGALRDLKTKRAKLVAKIDVLSATEHYPHARLWYRDARYAYIHVHPPGGERSKHYVGTDAAKIKEAQEAIDRGTQFLGLKSDLATLDADLFDLRGAVASERRRAHDVFTGQQRMEAHLRSGDRMRNLARAIASPLGDTRARLASSATSPRRR